MNTLVVRRAMMHAPVQRARPVCSFIKWVRESMKGVVSVSAVYEYKASA